MARILTPYALCPLTERKRFVGVSLDSECGCIIVTLARNIVIRYRLSNQKQVSSWSTKAMLSAPVIYDHSSKSYYGVFNSDEVSSWEESAVSLGKLSRSKFIWLIHSIVSSEDCPAIIVYKNGVISPLKTDLANTKVVPSSNDEQLLPTEETIKDAKLVTLASVHFVAVCTSTDQGVSVLHLTPVDPDRGTRSSITLVRQGLKLTAHTIIEGDSPQIITLWSNGELYTLSLPVKTAFPGKLVTTVSCINASQPAVILPLGREHIVLYGATLNSEGAVVVILSRQFGLPESLTKFKVYDEDCRMWTCRNNLVLVQGGYIVVAPFRLNTVKLVSLVGGNKKLASDEKDQEMESSSLVMDNTAEGIAARINRMVESGHSEYRISDILLSEFLESKNNVGLRTVLENISDIPDKWLIQLAAYALDEDQSMVRKILTLPLVSDVNSLALIRRKLKLTQALKLMSITKEMLQEDDFGKPLLDWACLLCDADYMQCLLSKDEEVATTLKELMDVVEEQIESMVTYRSLLAEINYFKRGKVASNKTSVSSHTYFVEKIKLY